ncbi:heterokaryon incompatibility protein-domain-containing protein [Xylariaceae sp. FL0662B]|nr:heterokaryon incompatibility protein-domain-containing protein [Xylariaceae sp. FL0662B]
MVVRTSKPFKYTPLDVEKQEIRLIKLLPGEFNHDLLIHISHQSLNELGLATDNPPRRLSTKELQQTLPDDWTVRETIEGRYLFVFKTTKATSWEHPSQSFPKSAYFAQPEYARIPEYEALSYAWGRVPSKEPVYVIPEGQESSEQARTLRQSIVIRSNLAIALRHLRYTDRSRTLWIDAICINQDDWSERDLQIKRMGKIYGRSAAVLIWLGMASSSSPLALEKLTHLGSQVEHTLDGWYPSPDATEPALGDPRVPLPFDEKSWDTIQDLLSRTWFERVWVQQEARLARHAKVQCGFDTMPWNIFRRAIITLREKASLPKRLVGIVEDAREVCNSRYLNDFFWLMVMSRKQKCAEPRDKLYGVLSLCPPKLSQQIKPQHSKSVIDVYKDAFLAFSAITCRLDLLSHINYGTASWEMPSWVPDWSQGVDTFLQVNFFSTAAGMSKASYELVAPNTLRVKGVSVGEVHRAERAVFGESDRIFEIWRHSDALGIETWSGSQYEQLLDAFLDLLLVGCTRERYPTNLSYPSWQEFKSKYLKDLATDAISLGMLPEVRPSRLRNLSFVFTTQGLLGLAPINTEPGDLICVFLGCHMPMVCRPASSGNGFKIIGPCLVHGIMDGEAILGALPHPWIAEFYRDAMGVAVLHFRNKITGELTASDPRLGSLPAEWEHIERDRAVDDPRWFTCFRHKVSGETINVDPRMLEEELEKRGVRFRHFELI